MRYWWWNFGSVGMIFVMIFQIVFRIVIIWVIVTLIQNSWKFPKNTKDDEVLHILKRKYANWEISKKEYLGKKKDLL